MTTDKPEFTTCRICHKPTKYKKCLGHICWKCKRNKEITGVKKTQAPVRCGECGHLITIVPCVACNMQRNIRNAKKESQS